MQSHTDQRHLWDSVSSTNLTNLIRNTRNNLIQIHQLLFSPFCDTNVRDRYGVTPLIVAVEYQNIGCIELLLLHHTLDINRCDIAGWTPLMHACVRGNIDIISLLLTRCDIDLELFSLPQHHNKILNDHLAKEKIKSSRQAAILAQKTGDPPSPDTPLVIDTATELRTILRQLQSQEYTTLSSIYDKYNNSDPEYAKIGQIKVNPYELLLNNILPTPNMATNALPYSHLKHPCIFFPSQHNALSIACAVGHLDVVKLLTTTSATTIPGMVKDRSRILTDNFSPSSPKNSQQILPYIESPHQALFPKHFFSQHAIFSYLLLSKTRLYLQQHFDQLQAHQEQLSATRHLQLAQQQKYHRISQIQSSNDHHNTLNPNIPQKPPHSLSIEIHTPPLSSIVPTTPTHATPLPLYSTTPPFFTHPHQFNPPSSQHNHPPRLEALQESQHRALTTTPSLLLSPLSLHTPTHVELSTLDITHQHDYEKNAKLVYNIHTLIYSQLSLEKITQNRILITQAIMADSPSNSPNSSHSSTSTFNFINPNHGNTNQTTKLTHHASLFNSMYNIVQNTAKVINIPQVLKTMQSEQFNDTYHSLLDRIIASHKTEYKRLTDRELYPFLYNNEHNTDIAAQIDEIYDAKHNYTVEKELKKLNPQLFKHDVPSPLSLVPNVNQNIKNAAMTFFGIQEQPDPTKRSHSHQTSRSKLTSQHHKSKSIILSTFKLLTHLLSRYQTLSHSTPTSTSTTTNNNILPLSLTTPSLSAILESNNIPNTEVLPRSAVHSPLYTYLIASLFAPLFPISHAFGLPSHPLPAQALEPNYKANQQIATTPAVYTRVITNTSYQFNQTHPGINLGVGNSNNELPLHVAAVYGRWQIVYFLLFGVDPPLPHTTIKKHKKTGKYVYIHDKDYDEMQWITLLTKEPRLSPDILPKSLRSALFLCSKYFVLPKHQNNAQGIIPTMDHSKCVQILLLCNAKVLDELNNKDIFDILLDSFTVDHQLIKEQQKREAMNPLSRFRIQSIDQGGGGKVQMIDSFDLTKLNEDDNVSRGLFSHIVDNIRTFQARQQQQFAISTQSLQMSSSKRSQQFHRNPAMNSSQRPGSSSNSIGENNDEYVPIYGLDDDSADIYANQNVNHPYQCDHVVQLQKQHVMSAIRQIMTTTEVLSVIVNVLLDNKEQLKVSPTLVDENILPSGNIGSKHSTNSTVCRRSIKQQYLKENKIFTHNWHEYCTCDDCIQSYLYVLLHLQSNNYIQQPTVRSHISNTNSSSQFQNQRLPNTTIAYYPDYSIFKTVSALPQSYIKQLQTLSYENQNRVNFDKIHLQYSLLEYQNEEFSKKSQNTEDFISDTDQNALLKGHDEYIFRDISHIDGAFPVNNALWLQLLSGVCWESNCDVIMNKHNITISSNHSYSENEEDDDNDIDYDSNNYCIVHDNDENNLTHQPPRFNEHKDIDSITDNVSILLESLLSYNYILSSKYKQTHPHFKQLSPIFENLDEHLIFAASQGIYLELMPWWNTQSLLLSRKSYQHAFIPYSNTMTQYFKNAKLNINSISPRDSTLKRSTTLKYNLNNTLMEQNSPIICLNILDIIYQLSPAYRLYLQTDVVSNYSFIQDNNIDQNNSGNNSNNNSNRSNKNGTQITNSCYHTTSLTPHSLLLTLFKSFNTHTTLLHPSTSLNLLHLPHKNLNESMYTDTTSTSSTTASSNAAHAFSQNTPTYTPQVDFLSLVFCLFTNNNNNFNTEQQTYQLSTLLHQQLAITPPSVPSIILLRAFCSSFLALFAQFTSFFVHLLTKAACSLKTQEATVINKLRTKPVNLTSTGTLSPTMTTTPNSTSDIITPVLLPLFLDWSFLVNSPITSQQAVGNMMNIKGEDIDKVQIVSTINNTSDMQEFYTSIVLANITSRAKYLENIVSQRVDDLYLPHTDDEGSPPNEKVKLYYLPTCSHCHDTLEWLFAACQPPSLFQQHISIDRKPLDSPSMGPVSLKSYFPTTQSSSSFGRNLTLGDTSPRLVGLKAINHSSSNQSGPTMTRKGSFSSLSLNPIQLNQSNDGKVGSPKTITPLPSSNRILSEVLSQELNDEDTQNDEGDIYPHFGLRPFYISPELHESLKTPSFMPIMSMFLPFITPVQHNYANNHLEHTAFTGGCPCCFIFDQPTQLPQEKTNGLQQQKHKLIASINTKSTITKQLLKLSSLYSNIHKISLKVISNCRLLLTTFPSMHQLLSLYAHNNLHNDVLFYEHNNPHSVALLLKQRQLAIKSPVLSQICHVLGEDDPSPQLDENENINNSSRGKIDQIDVFNGMSNSKLLSAIIGSSSPISLFNKSSIELSYDKMMLFYDSTTLSITTQLQCHFDLVQQIILQTYSSFKLAITTTPTPHDKKQVTRLQQQQQIDILSPQDASNDPMSTPTKQQQSTRARSGSVVTGGHMNAFRDDYFPAATPRKSGGSTPPSFDSINDCHFDGEMNPQHEADTQSQNTTQNVSNFLSNVADKAIGAVSSAFNQSFENINSKNQIISPLFSTILLTFHDDAQYMTNILLFHRNYVLFRILSNQPLTQPNFNLEISPIPLSPTPTTLFPSSSAISQHHYSPIPHQRSTSFSTNTSQNNHFPFSSMLSSIDNRQAKSQLQYNPDEIDQILRSPGFSRRIDYSPIFYLYQPTVPVIPNSQLPTTENTIPLFTFLSYYSEIENFLSPPHHEISHISPHSRSITPAHGALENNNKLSTLYSTSNRVPIKTSTSSSRLSSMNTARIISQTGHDSASVTQKETSRSPPHQQPQEPLCNQIERLPFLLFLLHYHYTTSLNNIYNSLFSPHHKSLDYFVSHVDPNATPPTNNTQLPLTSPYSPQKNHFLYDLAPFQLQHVTTTLPPTTISNSVSDSQVDVMITSHRTITTTIDDVVDEITTRLSHLYAIDKSIQPTAIPLLNDVMDGIYGEEPIKEVKSSKLESIDGLDRTNPVELVNNMLLMQQFCQGDKFTNHQFDIDQNQTLLNSGKTLLQAHTSSHNTLESLPTFNSQNTENSEFSPFYHFIMGEFDSILDEIDENDDKYTSHNPNTSTFDKSVMITKSGCPLYNDKYDPFYETEKWFHTTLSHSCLTMDHIDEDRYKSFNTRNINDFIIRRGIDPNVDLSYDNPAKMVDSGLIMFPLKSSEQLLKNTQQQLELQNGFGNMLQRPTPSIYNTSMYSAVDNDSNLAELNVISIQNNENIDQNEVDNNNTINNLIVIPTILVNNLIPTINSPYSHLKSALEEKELKSISNNFQSNLSLFNSKQTPTFIDLVTPPPFDPHFAMYRQWQAEQHENEQTRLKREELERLDLIQQKMALQQQNKTNILFGDNDMKKLMNDDGVNKNIDDSHLDNENSCNISPSQIAPSSSTKTRRIWNGVEWVNILTDLNDSNNIEDENDLDGINIINQGDADTDDRVDVASIIVPSITASSSSHVHQNNDDNHPHSRRSSIPFLSTPQRSYHKSGQNNPQQLSIAQIPSFIDDQSLTRHRKIQTPNRDVILLKQRKKSPNIDAVATPHRHKSSTHRPTQADFDLARSLLTFSMTAKNGMIGDGDDPWEEAHGDQHVNTVHDSYRDRNNDENITGIAKKDSESQGQIYLVNDVEQKMNSLMIDGALLTSSPKNCRYKRHSLLSHGANHDDLNLSQIDTDHNNSTAKFHANNTDILTKNHRSTSFQDDDELDIDATIFAPLPHNSSHLSSSNSLKFEFSHSNDPDSDVHSSNINEEHDQKRQNLGQSFNHRVGQTPSQEYEDGTDSFDDDYKDEAQPTEPEKVDFSSEFFAHLDDSPLTHHNAIYDENEDDEQIEDIPSGDESNDCNVDVSDYDVQDGDSDHPHQPVHPASSPSCIAFLAKLQIPTTFIIEFRDFTFEDLLSLHFDDIKELAKNHTQVASKIYLALLKYKVEHGLE